MAEVKIACPKCAWEPQPTDQWPCSCGHTWHVFDTGGRCPACKKQWDMTQCFDSDAGGCGEWSPHLDWYKNLGDWLKEEIAKIKVRIEEPTLD